MDKNNTYKINRDEFEVFEVKFFKGIFKGKSFAIEMRSPVVGFSNKNAEPRYLTTLKAVDAEIGPVKSEVVLPVSSLLGALEWFATATEKDMAELMAPSVDELKKRINNTNKIIMANESDMPEPPKSHKPA